MRRPRSAVMLRSLLVGGLFVAASAAPALAAEASTDPIEVCYFTVHFHEAPVEWSGVIGSTITVNPNAGHVHQDCIYIDPK